MRHTASVTSLSWIPSEAVAGSTRLAFDKGVTHYDEPPPDTLGELMVLRDADRFRFANNLAAYVDVDGAGRITGSGYCGQSMIGSTTVRVGSMSHCFQAFALPDIQHEPEHGDGWVRFIQTAGGRTGLPAPRRVRRAPFIQWQAPLAWTTLSLTIYADGRSKGLLQGASRFPRHWVYDDRGELSHKSGLTDFHEWYRRSFGKQTPWGDQDSEVLVTATETALERSLSVQLMSGSGKPTITKVKPGTALVEEGDSGTDVFLILDGVLRVEKAGERLAEYGPGAMLGERTLLEGGGRTATLRAVTACRVASVPAERLDRSALEELAKGHRLPAEEAH